MAVAKDFIYFSVYLKAFVDKLYLTAAFTQKLQSFLGKYAQVQLIFFSWNKTYMSAKFLQLNFFYIYIL